MSGFSTPGVYVEELISEPKPISGASTSIAAFIGSARSGPYNEAVLIGSFSEFEAIFGGFISSPRQYLGYAVDMFFKNGGRNAYIVRAAGKEEPAQGQEKASMELLDNASAPTTESASVAATDAGKEDPESETWIDAETPVDDKLDAPRDFEAAISALEKVDDASILVVPGECGADIYDKMITHCAKMKYRVAILDPKQGLSIAEVINSRANEMSSLQGYAAVYYPWLRIVDPITEEIVSVPPSGAVAGVYARVDRMRGVHKAPANEELLELAGLDVQLTNESQALLNPDGINAIRFIKGSGNLVWGARTISTDPSRRYVNVCRLLIYLEQSICNGTQWVVFEPNNENLWSRVKTTIMEFLRQAWRDGMLVGSVPEDAFYVKCDRTTMNQSNIDSGELIAEIGVALVKPADFIVFRITQWCEDIYKNDSLFG